MFVIANIIINKIVIRNSPSHQPQISSSFLFCSSSKPRAVVVNTPSLCAGRSSHPGIHTPRAAVLRARALFHFHFHFSVSRGKCVLRKIPAQVCFIRRTNSSQNLACLLCRGIWGPAGRGASRDPAPRASFGISGTPSDRPPALSPSDAVTVTPALLCEHLPLHFK